MKGYSFKWFAPRYGQAFSIAPDGCVTQVVATAGYAAIVRLGQLGQFPSSWLPCPSSEFDRLKEVALNRMGLIDQEALHAEQIEAYEATEFSDMPRLCYA